MAYCIDNTKINREFVYVSYTSVYLQLEFYELNLPAKY